MIQILNRWTGATIYEVEAEAETLADAIAKMVEDAAKEGRDADLTRAELTRANLRGANLFAANLRGANLGGADLFAAAREDLWSILNVAPAEVPALLKAVREGRVDGSVYEGECSCLLGTIATARGVDYDKLGITPSGSRPAEAFFAAICPGHLPAFAPHAALAEAWIELWQARNPAPAFVAAEVRS